MKLVDWILGSHFDLKDFILEYQNENNEDKTVEIIDPVTEEVRILSEEEFKKEFSFLFKEGVE